MPRPLALLLGLVLVGTVPMAAGVAVRTAVLPRAVPPMQAQTVTGDFRLHNNTRCNGHYRAVTWEQDVMDKCRLECQHDEKCFKFSLESEHGHSCFLYDGEASCIIDQGWATGYKDTRCAVASEESVAMLRCPYGTVISRVLFASYGTPSGVCGRFAAGSCHLENSHEVVEDLCLGESECRVSATSHLFGEPCPMVAKELRVQVECSPSKTFNEDVYFNAWSSRHWADAELEVQERHQEISSFLGALPAYPAGKFAGRGIIIVAGGRYLEPAVIMIKMLREIGCTLRIQIWHLGQEEMTDAHRELLRPYNVETRDFRDYVTEEGLRPIMANVGMRLFQLKPLALLHSDLEDVLLLDSDNCPIRDPSYLFDSPVYQTTGTVFWPDYWKTSAENPIWKIVGVEPSASWEQESGQLMINKQHAWRALNLCVHINSEFYMRLLNGDKDTFRFSWIAAGVEFHMVEHWPEAVGTLKQLHSNTQGFCSHTMLQHDLDGAPLFVHHNQLKSGAHMPVGENFKYKKSASRLGQPFKAAPVEGLRTASGVVIPCIDIQGAGLPQVDDDVCDVAESHLGDFERRYFAAQASFPATSITSEERKRPSLLAKVDDAAAAAAVVADSAAERVRSLMERLRHGDQNTTCTADEFELEPPTLSTDRQCEKLTVCDADQTEVQAPTATTDRVCSQATAPAAPRTFTVRLRAAKTPEHPYFGVGSTQGYEVRDSADPSGEFVQGRELTITRLETYEFHMDGVPDAQPFILTLDNVGGADSMPYVAGLLGSGAADSQHVAFTPGPSTPSMLYYHSHTESHVGWRIHVRDPTFRHVYTGTATAGAPGPQQRFGTAYSPDARLFEHSSEGPAPGQLETIRSACQAQCAVATACKGIYVYQTSQRVVCYGLSSVAGSPAPAVSSSESWAKVVQ